MKFHDCYCPVRDGSAETSDRALRQHFRSTTGDPWHAFGYIVAGVFVYGALGWGLDRWLGTTFIVAIGILLGAGFGIYMTWARFRPPSTDQ